MAILYIETNFPVGIAKGQDVDSDQLLFEARPGSLRMPVVCYLEALSVLRAEQHRFRELFKSFDGFDREAGRDATASAAGRFRTSLQEGKAAGAAVLNAIEQRLYDALEQLAAAAESLQPSVVSIQATRRTPLIADPTDALILSMILEDAGRSPQHEKGFLSANTRDFDEPGVRAALKAAGIIYLGTAKAARNWIGSRKGELPEPGSLPT